MNPFLIFQYGLVSAFVVLLGTFLLVTVSESVAGSISQLFGLYTKNKTLQFLGIGMGGVLLALQALMSYKRAKALEDTAKAQVEAAKAQAKATEEQAKANENTEQGQRQERLKNAIEHLGHDNTSVRLGGAYELFHLAEDTAQDTKDLRQTVLDILCAHIRRTTGEAKYREKYNSKPSEEMQSLLTLLFVQDHEVFKGLRINLQGSWLNGADLQRARLRNAVLTKVNLQGAQLNEANLQEVLLVEADLRGAQLDGVVLRRARLFKANLEKAQAQFEKVDLRGAQLVEANLQEAQLVEANLQEAQLVEADLRGAQLKEADLRGAQLVEANLQEAQLVEADLRGAQLKEADLRGAQLFEADLQGARLEEAQLRGAQLERANLQGAWPYRANLQGARLDNACLRGVQLFEANLQGADLSWVDLRGAWLKETDLRGARLDGVKLQGVKSEPGRPPAGYPFAEFIKDFIGRNSDLSKAIFGELNQKDVDSIVEGLSDEKATRLRERLRSHIGRPPSHELPKNSGAITGAYTAEEAERWIAEYEAAMAEVPEINN